MKIGSIVLIAAITAGVGASTIPALPQTHTEIIIEARTQMWFAAPAETVQALLPAGFTSAPIAAGPNQGGNISVVMIDRRLIADAEGKLKSGTTRGAILVVPARRNDAPVVMIVDGWMDDPGSAPGFFKVFEVAGAHLVRSESDKGSNLPKVSEDWTIAAEGVSIHLAVEYERDTPTLVRFNQNSYSGADPAVNRNHRGHNGLQVLYSVTTNVGRTTRREVAISGPALSVLANARLVSILSLPWYYRDSYEN